MSMGYGFFRGNLWSALTVRIASVTSAKVARRGTFDASTSPSVAADTCLRQSGDQVPSLDGQYAISRSCGIRGGMRESRMPIYCGRKGHRLAEKHQICGASAISGHERHFWTWLAHGIAWPWPAGVEVFSNGLLGGGGSGERSPQELSGDVFGVSRLRRGED